MWHSSECVECKLCLYKQQAQKQSVASESHVMIPEPNNTYNNKVDKTTELELLKMWCDKMSQDGPWPNVGGKILTVE